MGKVITHINEKGGIGKTSCAFNAAWALAEKKRVLLIDMDGQRANLTFFAGIKKSEKMPTIYDVLLQDRDVEETIIKLNERLDLIPATSNVADLSQNAKITKFRRALESIREKYDYVMIDVNPTPNWTHVLSLSVSDYIIIPMLPDITSLEANKGIAESIAEILDTTNPKLKVLGLVFNKNVNNTNLSKQVKQIADAVAEQLGTTVFETKIRNSITLSESAGSHVGVTEYAPKSAVAQDIREYVAEIERRIKANG